MKNLLILCCLCALLIGCEKERFQPDNAAAPTDIRPESDLTDQFDLGTSVRSFDFDGYDIDEAESILREYLTTYGLEEVDGRTLDNGETFDPTPRLDPEADDCQQCRERIEARRLRQQREADRRCSDLYSIFSCCVDTDGAEDAMLFVVLTRTGC